MDDEPSITELLATALRYMGDQVSTAATGFAALEAAATAARGATFEAWLPFTASSQPDPGAAPAPAPTL